MGNKVTQHVIYSIKKVDLVFKNSTDLLHQDCGCLIRLIDSDKTTQKLSSDSDSNI